MKPEFYKPHPLLSDYVSHYMIVDVKFDGPAYNHYIPFPPTPQHSIHFYPGDAMKTRKSGKEFSFSADSVIIGPQVTRVDLSMGAHHILVSVAFQPGGLYRLLKIPMYELYDEPYNAVDVLGSQVAVINEKLRIAKSHLEMKNVIEAYLLRKVKISPLNAFERSVKMMLKSHSQLSMDRVADLSCLSTRQFERKAKEVIGYSPKFFSRLIRFSKAYRMKVNQPKISWTSIGYHCGYYDQMHLIRDFKEFAGANPQTLNREILMSPMQVQDHMRI